MALIPYKYVLQNDKTDKNRRSIIANLATQMFFQTRQGSVHSSSNDWIIEEFNNINLKMKIKNKILTILITFRDNELFYRYRTRVNTNLSVLRYK